MAQSDVSHDDAHTFPPLDRHDRWTAVTGGLHRLLRVPSSVSRLYRTVKRASRQQHRAADLADRPVMPLAPVAALIASPASTGQEVQDKAIATAYTAAMAPVSHATTKRLVITL